MARKINNLQECWKPIEGYHDLYEVSNFGRVRSYCGLGQGAGKRVSTPRVLRPRPNRSGYLYIQLPRDGGYHNEAVHRLVALAFVGSPPAPDATVNHKDRDKANNAASNLEWMTHADNIRHASPFVRRPRGQRGSFLKLWDDGARRIREAYLFGASPSDLAKVYGVTTNAIWDVTSRRKWKHVEVAA